MLQIPSKFPFSLSKGCSPFLDRRVQTETAAFNNELLLIRSLGYTSSNRWLLCWKPSHCVQITPRNVQSRTPAPKYDSVWSVTTVLHFVSEQLSTESLTLKQLSKKLAVLLALTNASCSSDLNALDLDYCQFTLEGVLFRIPDLTKTRRSGPPKEAFFTSFEEDPKLCPVTTLRSYERATEKWRSPDMKPNLLF